VKIGDSSDRGYSAARQVGLPLSIVDRLPDILAVSFLLGTLLLLQRRLAGALAEPLPATALAALAIVPLGAVWALRGWARKHRQQTSRLAAAQAMLTVGAILMAVALSLPGSAAWTVALLWLSSVLTAIVAVGQRFTSLWRRGRLGRLQARSRNSEADVVSRLTRARAINGEETIRGRLRIEFAAGQRTAAAHVAFCPPFAELPRVQGALRGSREPAPPARVRVGAVLHHGARFEVKLAEPATAPLSMRFDFTAAGRGVSDQTC
jgi:hypothetical protein